VLGWTFEPVGSGQLSTAFVGVNCSDLLALLQHHLS
jgi:hypothetical protein